MMKAITSDQFVAGIISVLALSNKKRFVLTGTELDAKFAAAFEDLVTQQSDLNIIPNFSFYVDQMHGDSACLRDTLNAAKEKELVHYNNPTFRTFEVKLSDERAETYLKRSPLPRQYLERVVAKYF
jgi:hypothetical protein